MDGLQNPAFDGSESTAGGSPSKTRPVGVVRPVQSNGAGGDAGSLSHVKVEDGGDVSTCGWGPFKPKCLQCCNRPAGFLVFVCIFGFVQGMTVNGLVYVVTTTLERRFNIPSIRSGFISSCYDFGTLIVVAFVTYFGERAHKPVWLGLGALGFSCGSILFTVPHYLTGLYQFESVDVPTCDLNSTMSGGSAELEPGLSRYYIVFIVAQLIHGISASGLYTLGYTYIDENSPVTRASIYVGIFQASSLFGPACGYLIGGLILEIYTDLGVDTSQLGITSESPLWIGAWWTGFILTASIAFLVAFPLMAFPRSLPGKKKKVEVISQAQKGSEFQHRSGLKNNVMDFPKAIWNLIKNLPFLFMSIGVITEWFLLTSFATFGPKYLETQFSMTASDAALLAGYVIIPAGLSGTIAGGIIVSKLKLHFKGMIIMALVCLFISLLSIPSFLISCDNPAMAGVTVQYTNTSLVFEGGEAVLDSACNAECGCGSAFDPVCGSNGVMYYTPCHAGCDVINTTSSVKAYSNCSCIEAPDNGRPSSAVSGKCPQDCNNQILFIVLFFVMLALTLMATVPVTMATMRCVSHEQRTFALGFQSVLFRAFGTVPSPVVFGALIDQTCILWEEDDSGGRQCWQYDNDAFSRTSLILAMTLRCVSLVFLVICLCVYKPGPSGLDPGAAEGETAVESAEEAASGETREKENGFHTKL
ncbi:solute carrier organic anion transporter family member 4A1 [Strongylocentrotus purpuratus]|uniref:Solute carrier organic anion transporter family member n=1 Tax=Strongylocentrotus purpuratus TaxID=7668 RepID=A0A7M7STG3_STRPU|nr:solute carrier organic anion transporter family member 4A1 [Strongylocentrotus purpuratus]XP_030830204.1 solute carrier organic anion transporter family member 4A1 [Strongylocentrotus purpuratus]